MFNFDIEKKLYNKLEKSLIRINNLFIGDIKRDNIFNKEWDYLFILDGCRLDTFHKNNVFQGDLKKIISEGSCTSEWIFNSIKNANKNLKDILYISANPYVSNLYITKEVKYLPFFKIIDVWKDGWSDELNTVHPSEVNKSFLVSLSRYKKNGFKYILHYMQPHHPFIGNIKIKEKGWMSNREKILYNKSIENNEKVWDLARKKIISREKLYTAYESNLKLVLKYIKNILPYIEGKVCLTSDHGNLFGKYGFIYAHPCYFINYELLNVPWFEFD